MLKFKGALTFRMNIPFCEALALVQSPANYGISLRDEIHPVPRSIPTDVEGSRATATERGQFTCTIPPFPSSEAIAAPSLWPTAVEYYTEESEMSENHTRREDDGRCTSKSSILNRFDAQT